MAKKKSKQKNEYFEKYKDPRWQKIRLKVLERDEWVCKKCYDPDSTLHIHHRYYLKNKEPWEYPLESLITLCEECHNYEKELRLGYEKSLLFALREKFLAEDISELAIGFHEMELLSMSEVIASVYKWALSKENIQRELIDKYFAYLENKKNNNG